MSLLAPLFVVMLAGVGIALETPTNAMLAKASSSAMLASLVSFILGGAVLALGVLILRPKGAPGWTTTTPWWAWVGGAYGAVAVLASAWATPKLGAGATLVIIVATQVGLGVALDNFGALGLEPHPAGWLRLLGLGVVVAGAAMVAAG